MNTLREARERIEMPQYRLAVLLGKSTTWVWKVEVGVLRPKPEDRRRISEALGVPEADVFPEARP